MNTEPKYVASRTLGAPLAWSHASLRPGDAVSAVAALRLVVDPVVLGRCC